MTKMKKTIILIIMTILSISHISAQMILDHSFTTSIGGYQNAEIVNLSISGKKILVETDLHTLTFYNLDYSLWKTISLPSIPPYGYPGTGGGMYNFLGMSGTMMYPSEELFNTDSLVEIAVFYGGTNTTSSAIYIINETGVAVDSIKNVIWNGTFLPAIMVYNTAPSTYKAVVNTSSGVTIFSLPGTIPCDICGNGLGLAKVSGKPSDVSDPIPNPSKDQVKITFTLPEGTRQGEIDLYNISGKLLKTYTVDNTFGFIYLNNSELPAGMYYYNLIADGNVTTTKKMIVLK
jgi:hypothetical protein